MPNVTKIEKSSKHQGIQIDPFTDEQIKGLESKGHKIEMIDSECMLCCRSRLVSMSTTCAIRFDYTGDKVQWEPAPEPRKENSGGSVYIAQ